MNLIKYSKFIFYKLKKQYQGEFMGLLNRGKKGNNYAKEFKELFIENKGTVNLDILIKCINEWELNISDFKQDANYHLAKSMICAIYVLGELSCGADINNLTKPLQSTLDSLRNADECSPKDSSLYEWYQVQSDITKNQLVDFVNKNNYFENKY